MFRRVFVGSLPCDLRFLCSDHRPVSLAKHRLLSIVSLGFSCSVSFLSEATLFTNLQKLNLIMPMLKRKMTDTTMIHWKLGITTVAPTKWRKRGEPDWKAIMRVSSDENFYKIADTLCQTTVKQQRQPKGLTYGTDGQIWNIKIATYENAVMGNDEVGAYQIVPSGTEEIWEHENKIMKYGFKEVLPCCAKISKSLLKQGSVIFFDYDQTECFLKVLNICRVRKLDTGTFYEDDDGSSSHGSEAL